MSPRTLGPPEIEAWIATLIRQYKVVGPQARGDRFAYDTLHSPAELRLDHDLTILPPKKYLLPATEVILSYTRNGEFRSVIPVEPLVIFGVHPYDVAAIAQMDRYFTEDHADIHYMTRRRNTTIVACDAQNASDHTFAACMETATVRNGCDLLLTLVGDRYVAESMTPAGDALLALAVGTQEADPVSLGRREQVWADARKLLSRKLRVSPKDIPALLERATEHPVWKQKSEACLSCGSCVMVCPTCFCFDVQDEVGWDLASGERHRQWDACLLADFALVAGGHNFRKPREDRYRHRFYRKGKHLHDRFGYLACVGCGRCAAACTTGIADPVELFNALAEDSC